LRTATFLRTAAAAAAAAAATSLNHGNTQEEDLPELTVFQRIEHTV
jgi:hypothetical protein